MQRHPAIEARHALEELNGIFRRYEQLKYRHEEFLNDEIRQARQVHKNCTGPHVWQKMQSLPCGADDAYGDRLSAALSEVQNTMNAVRLARGRMPARVLELLRQIGEGA